MPGAVVGVRIRVKSPRAHNRCPVPAQMLLIWVQHIYILSLIVST